MKTSRNRILGITVSFLLSGAALGAVSGPARAAVGPITIDPVAAQAETTGAAFSIPVTAAGGDGTIPLTFAITEDKPLPAGSALAIANDTPTTVTDPTTAHVTGTLTAPYSGTVTVTASDSTPADTATAQFTLTAANKVTLPSPGAQSDPLGVAIPPLTVTATDSGGAAVTYTIAGQPAGLGINAATGVVTGTPATAGTFTTTITATDPTGATANAVFAWTITNGVTVKAPAAKLVTSGVAIAKFPVTATDTAPGATFTFSSNDLPPGLVIGPGGWIQGTPSGVHAVYVSHITATDNTGAKGTGMITWTVQNKVTVKPVPPQKIHPGTPYTLKLAATDSDPAQTKFTWKVVAPLPGGLRLNAATGVISGTPTGYATVSSTFTATDAAGSRSAASAPVKFTASQPVQIFNPGKVVTTVGQGVSVVISMKNLLAGEKTVRVTASGVPAGVTFVQSIGKPARNGVLTAGYFYGWPARAGTFKIIIRSKGSLGTAGWMTFPLVVAGTVTKNAPAGQIRLLLGGKCLQDPGSRTAGGTRIVIGNCVSNSTEHWIVASDGTIRINGRCLDIAGIGARYAGQPLQLWRCNGAAKEMFLQGTKGQLVNPVSGLCVTDPGSSRRNGTVARMGTCHFKAYEQWTLPAQPVLASVGGKCVDDHFSSMANGNVIDMYACNNTISQALSFMPDGTLRLFINKCVTVRNGKVVLWTCSRNGGGQRWTVIRGGGLSSELALGGACLAVPSLTAPDGAQLVMRSCSASDPKVHWHIW